MVKKLNEIEFDPPIEVFQLKQEYVDDKAANKIDLGVGSYQDKLGKPYVLPVVKEIERILGIDDTLHHNYLPILGLESFNQASVKLLLGKESSIIANNNYCAVQSLSGTGALFLGASFYKDYCEFNDVYVPNPTWGNHIGIFDRCGYQVHKYNYWNKETRSLDFESMYETIEKANANSIIILHSNAHNPTGVDPTREQWEKLVGLFIKRKDLIPFFDSAYLG
ncbi:hypothetical protein SNEBB_003506, partial [Seison nebaliae]